MANQVHQTKAHGFVESAAGKLEFYIKANGKEFRGSAKTKLGPRDWPLQGALEARLGLTLHDVYNGTYSFEYQLTHDNAELAFVKFYDDEKTLLGEFFNAHILPPPLCTTGEHGEGTGTWE